MSICTYARSVTFTLPLAFTACAGQPGSDSEPDSVGSSTADTLDSTGTGEPTGTGDSTGTGEPACVEDDLMPMPFAGPGYDPANGGLQEPLQDKYVASTTFLVLRPETAQEFLATVEPMIPVLMANQGLVGFSTATSAKCGTARTLTVWRDQMAMMDFVASDEHVAGMTRATEFSTTGTVTSWEVTRAELPLAWETAMARASAATPSY
ncbi:antibiotic biosynthesis monooxygenase family protein [Nannocystis pusilla]|uniref:DUF3291 domain-containing protein n=1 Tax=Nannocystis pusilla TaxID=889268 RepID=A0ABS7TUK1_9BACT|nr:DUF3291 domain-containing protein [Nannocystis pusilla]MBZ5711905.1 DUF3291 domain-containing protein [Nannocystis pusilla]